MSELSFLYINGLLEILNEDTGAFIVDERALFRPAGLAAFGRSRGGHLEDDPRLGRTVTVQRVESMVAEFAAIEQGMMLQNLGLMAEAMGLGGFPNFANHEYAWFESLGFRMSSMRASRYLSMPGWVGMLLSWTGRDVPVPLPLGLQVEEHWLMRASCPPIFPSMRDAVLSVVEAKFGASGVFRDSLSGHAWKDVQLQKAVPGLSERAIEATVAYCEYVWKRYGRSPATLPPFRTTVGFQACHLDAEFYDRFYRPEALSPAHRADFERCRGAGS